MNNKQLIIVTIFVAILVLSVEFYMLRVYKKVPILSSQANSESIEKLSIYEKLSNSSFSIESVGPNPCGEGPCEYPEYGAFAVENKEGGYRINLSTTILKPYIMEAGEDDYLITQDGNNLYFVSIKDRTVYKIDIRNKKIISLYKNKNFIPQTLPVIHNNELITTWEDATVFHPDKGIVVKTSLNTTLGIYKNIEYYFTAPNDPAYIRILLIDDIAFSQGDGNLIWVFTRYEPNCKSSYECSNFSLLNKPPKYTIIDLSSNFSNAVYKSKSETFWEEQPEEYPFQYQHDF